MRRGRGLHDVPCDNDDIWARGEMRVSIMNASAKCMCYSSRQVPTQLRMQDVRCWQGMHAGCKGVGGFVTGGVSTPLLCSTKQQK